VPRFLNLDFTNKTALHLAMMCDCNGKYRIAGIADDTEVIDW